jgi:uncharacterized protein (TIGR04222 family)
MTLSVIRSYALNNGTWSDAPLAAAAQIFELARKGYVRINLQRKPNNSAKEIHLRRVNKPIGSLSPEEQYLMAALFVDGDAKVLNSTHKRRVAQRLLTIARGQLMLKGLINTVTPRRLRRRVYLTYWGVALATGAATAHLIHDADSFMVWLVGVGMPWFVVWAVMGAFVDVNAIRRTREGKRLVKPIFGVYAECKYGVPDEVFSPAWLPYELLWGGRRSLLRALGSGAYDARPRWWMGGWPQTRQGKSLLLWETFEQMVISLNQDKAPDGWYPDRELEAKIQRNRDYYEWLSGISDDLSYASGGDGSGGNDGSHDSGGDGGHDGGGDGSGDHGSDGGHG